MLAATIRLFRALTLLSGGVFVLALLSFVPTILAEAGTGVSGTIAGFDFTDRTLILQRGAALGVSFILYVAFNTVTNLLAGYHSPGGGPASPTPDREGTATETAASQPTPEVYRSKFARMNLVIGAFFSLLLVGGLAASVAQSQGMVSGGLGGLLVGIIDIVVTVVGGIGVTFLNAAVFVGVWYGLKKRATEALLVGLVGWVLVALSGVVALTQSFRGIGLVIAGLYGIYYAVRARGSTEMTVLAGRMPTTVEDWFGSSSR